MAICYVNGREYQISKKIVLNRINPHNTEFTEKERNLIADEVIFRMECLEINGCDCQEYNFKSWFILNSFKIGYIIGYLIS